MMDYSYIDDIYPTDKLPSDRTTAGLAEGFTDKPTHS